jgi:serine-type D-Ala-D-Ala carboxypeptidase (penicillin-binding protein 5/6)
MYNLSSFMRCVFSLLMLCVAHSAAVAQQTDQAASFESKAPYAILLDARSGLVFYEKSASLAVPPASMSKLMTQSLVFDALKTGKLKPDQMVTISEHAWRTGGAPSGGSTMYAELNSSVSVMDLLRGAIIQSANDGCIALAEALGGTEPGFVQMMNTRAKELGLKESSFANATGLPDPNHKMSMRDLATLARYIISDHPDYFKIYGEKEFTWNKIRQQNRNPLLLDYPGADGMKTGYTREAGYGLVGTAVRDGRRLVLVIGGIDSIATRRDEAQKLLDFGFGQFKPFDIYEAGETVTTVRVWGGNESWVPLVTKDVFKISLSPFEQKSAEIKLDYKGPLLAPVKQGEEVGKVRIIVGGQTVADAPVFTANEITADESMWNKAFDSLVMMATGG